MGVSNILLYVHAPPDILDCSAAPDYKETSCSLGRSNLLGDVQKNCRKCRGYNKEREGSM